MRTNAITQSVQAELRKVENAKKTDKAAISVKATPIDRSDISADAQRLSMTKASIDVISATISQQNDIRPEKISEIKEKIKKGYYNSPEFIDKLAVKLLSEFGIQAQME